MQSPSPIKQNNFVKTDKQPTTPTSQSKIEPLFKNGMLDVSNDSEFRFDEISIVDKLQESDIVDPMPIISGGISN